MAISPTLLTEIETLYRRIYGDELFAIHGRAFFSLLERYHSKRPSWLKKMDENPQWFQQANMIGITLYIDLFSKDLTGLQSKVDYFQSMGVQYIHLMPLLKAREGNNDGGYAVEDYQAIEPRLGDIATFQDVIKTYMDHGIYIAIDFVLNHTAKEHRWAKKALEGDPFYQAYYLMYDNEVIPNEFNKTVPEVLPDIYPGNFTYYPEIKKHVFTSFSEFQWDLNFANPYVLHDIVDIFLWMTYMGVAMIRLDAIPFLWKELGTTCRNLPRVHDLMRLFQAVKQAVAPGVAILGEAIVEPEQIYRYFGTEKQPECDVLYNAISMVNIWDAIATRDTRMMAHELTRFPAPKHATWMNYVRCHDDIGWGFNEDFIRSTGRDPYLHKHYLISFFNGSFPYSFARGQNYQENAKTGDARTNGTLSALLGFEEAMEIGHPEMIERAFLRFELIHKLLFTLPGMPLIYSGDEWLQPNDKNHADKPGKKDGRWMHRPVFAWEKVQHPEKYPLESRAFTWLNTLIRFRQTEARFSNQASFHVLPSTENAVLILQRDEEKPLIAIFNFSEFPKMIHLPTGQGSLVLTDPFTLKTKNVFDGQCHLDPYESCFLNL